MSALTARDVLAAVDTLTARSHAMPRRLIRSVATWHVVGDDDHQRIRVVVTWYGPRDVVAQRGRTVGTLVDAWRVAISGGAVHRSLAHDRDAFRSWAMLARRGVRHST